MKNILNIAKYLANAAGRFDVSDLDFELAVALLNDYPSYNMTRFLHFMDLFKSHFHTENILDKYESSINYWENAKGYFYKGITIYDMIKKGEKIENTKTSITGTGSYGSVSIKQGYIKNKTEFFKDYRFFSELSKLGIKEYTDKVLSDDEALRFADKEPTRLVAMFSDEYYDDSDLPIYPELQIFKNKDKLEGKRSAIHKELKNMLDEIQELIEPSKFCIRLNDIRHYQSRWYLNELDEELERYKQERQIQEQSEDEIEFIDTLSKKIKQVRESELIELHKELVNELIHVDKRLYGMFLDWPYLVLKYRNAEEQKEYEAKKKLREEQRKANNAKIDTLMKMLDKLAEKLKKDTPSNSDESNKQNEPINLDNTKEINSKPKEPVKATTQTNTEEIKLKQNEPVNAPSETIKLDNAKNSDQKNEIPKQETKPLPIPTPTKLFLKQIKKLGQNLKSKIYGQDEAIKSVIDSFMAMSYADLPIKAIFLFLGPPATGKTYLAELIGEFMEYPIKIFDMTRYQSDNQSFGLTGSEKGYHEASDGDLTSFVKENPKSICVFDEIEKAHPNVQNVFLEIMARGKTNDQYTKESVNFSQCMFIFTSNLCSEIYTNDEFITKNQGDKHKLENMVIEALKREKSSAFTRGGGEAPVFKQEFISRLAQGEIVLFKKLPFSSFVKAGEISLKDAMRKFATEYSCVIKINDLASLVKIYILSFLPNLDMRAVKTKLAKTILSMLNDLLLDNENIAKINLEIKQVAIDKFNSFITDDETANDKFLQERFKRNETIRISTKQELKDYEVTIFIEDISIEKVPKSKDFSSEEGSIIVDFPDVKFSDIAGHKRAKERLSEVLTLLKNRKNLLQYDVKPPRGMLLFGPPGTGKTALAKAFANEADFPFIATTGTEILDLKFMKQIFKRAREYAPAIIFIDEIDAIGSRDGSRYDMFINQFLTEINGFDDKEEIFIIAATNFIEKLDPAILRSGRIDIHIKIDALDAEARRYFIDKISKKTDKELDKDMLVKLSAGMSGADLEKAYNQSIYQALRENKEISSEILAEQINVVKYGEKLSDKGYGEIMKSTAYHEAGHAVISHILMKTKIEQITVSPRGNALGFVAFNDEDRKANLTFDEIKNQICVVFAGRTAQIKFEGEAGLDEGASSDLAVATNLAYRAVAVYGMSELGYVNVSKHENMLKSKIDEKVLEILNEQKQRCEELVNLHFEKIEKVALALVDKEIIFEDEFLNMMKNSD